MGDRRVNSKRKEEIRTQVDADYEECGDGYLHISDRYELLAALDEAEEENEIAKANVVLAKEAWKMERDALWLPLLGDFKGLTMMVSFLIGERKWTAANLREAAKETMDICNKCIAAAEKAVGK
jgi:hypothetical protein